MKPFGGGARVQAVMHKSDSSMDPASICENEDVVHNSSMCASNVMWHTGTSRLDQFEVVQLEPATS